MYLLVYLQGLEKRLGFGFVPVLVFYHDRIPIVYRGNLEDETAVVAWLRETASMSEIEEVSGPVLDYLIDRLDSLAVVFYSNDEDTNESDDEQVLSIMETLDDDMDRISVAMVKISDEAKALEFGLEDLPALVYFKNEVPGDSFCKQ